MWRILLLLPIALAYYLYLPLPSTFPEKWKLMMNDAAIRTMMHVGELQVNNLDQGGSADKYQDFFAHKLGLSHPFSFVQLAMSGDIIKTPQSSPGVRVTDTSFAGVEARVFESTSQGLQKDLKRGVVYFHGGGWTIASARMKDYDTQCRTMAKELDAVVISVEYRLAPKARFPDQFNDAFQAAKHILTAEVLAQYSIDPRRVAVSGDSAGGNLAAAVSQQLAIDASAPIKFKVQALIYPALQALDLNTPSFQQNRHIPILRDHLMARFLLEYLNGSQDLVPSLLANKHSAQNLGHEVAAAKAKINWTKLLPVSFQKNYKPMVPIEGDPKLLEMLPGLLDVRAAPLLAEQEVLKVVPPAYIMVCEHDVLRDDGLMYAKRLEEAGVPVTIDHYKDGFHGAINFVFVSSPFAVSVESFGNYMKWLNENL